MTFVSMRITPDFRPAALTMSLQHHPFLPVSFSFAITWIMYQRYAFHRPNFIRPHPNDGGTTVFFLGKTTDTQRRHILTKFALNYNFTWPGWETDEPS